MHTHTMLEATNDPKQLQLTAHPRKDKQTKKETNHLSCFVLPNKCFFPLFPQIWLTTSCLNYRNGIPTCCGVEQGLLLSVKHVPVHKASYMKTWCVKIRGRWKNLCVLHKKSC